MAITATSTIGTQIAAFAERRRRLRRLALQPDHLACQLAAGGGRFGVAHAAGRGIGVDGAQLRAEMLGGCIRARSGPR